MKVVVIGGVAGGASCVARLRRLNEEAEIVLLERGDYVSYANCGLPYFVGDVIAARDALLLMTPERLKERFNVDVRVKNEVVEIDREQKEVVIKKVEDGSTYRERYDYLVIATGSSPFRPNIPGIDSDRVLSLWTVPDADRIREAIEREKVQHVAVVGGGFIGLETAENLLERGLKVTVIEGAPQVMPPFDPELAGILHGEIRRHGVDLRLGVGVQGFKEENGESGKKVVVSLNDGSTTTVDLVVLAIGIRPNSAIAKDAGLTLNARGGIVVSNDLVTNDPAIYAIGDAIEVNDPIFGGKTAIALAGPANKQGRIAANNIARRLDANSPLGSEPEEYDGTMGTSVAKIFDMTAASVGTNEKVLGSKGLERGKNYETLLINQNSHAGYYPGATQMFLKLIFSLEEGNRILGAQIVGADGVDKRIDTIAVAMKLGASVQKLKELELSYAPPYSSAKDPVNMAGFVAENILKGLVAFAPYDVVESETDALMLDVREDAERMAYGLPDSLGVPLGSLRTAIDESQPEIKELLDARESGREVVVFCAAGVRAYVAARILSNKGFDAVKIYPGGFRFYRALHPSPSDLTPTAPEIENNPSTPDETESKETIRVDCRGLQCPGPLMRVYTTMQDVPEGQIVEVISTDPGFSQDIISWSRQTGNELISNVQDGKNYVATLRKTGGNNSAATETCADGNRLSSAPAPNNKTIIVFDGDYDKVMASFVIANGALAMGRKVTMFFTFWGLAALRKEKAPKRLEKSMLEKMFGCMLPRGAGRLKLSKMHMGGMGRAMMKKIMRDKNVDSLEDMIETAISMGVKIVACSMSMDVMGFKQEELIDGVEIGGVGAYLGDAENANVNLFI